MAAIDPWNQDPARPESLCRKAAAVVPSDVEELERVSRLYVGGAGDVAVVLAGDSSPITFKAASGFLQVLVKQVMATGTTATDIVACY